MKRHRKAHKQGQNWYVENHAKKNGNKNGKIDERENQEGAKTTIENMSAFENILDLFKS